MTASTITLVGDGIENPRNACTLIHAAQLFNADCRFVDRKDLATSWDPATCGGAPLPTLSVDELGRDHAPIIACDTLQGAQDIYGFRAAPGHRPALVVGNERTGLSHRVQNLAHQRVRIPMAARGIDCLNVAAAAAVALYYLRRGGGPMASRRDPAAHRPDVLLLGASDHVELGSAIRSAAAFGWAHLLVEDRAGVWFGCDRVTRSEGRAAARRGKNAIRLIPVQADRRYAYDEACVVTCGPGGIPLQRAGLARGARQLVILPDSQAVRLDAEEWSRLGRRVTHVSLDLPEAAARHYRLPASIILAEIARQVGRRDGAAGVAAPPRRGYRRAMRITPPDAGVDVPLEELLAY